MITASIGDRVAPAELLAAWRTAERSRAACRGPEAAALTAGMRHLMDRYAWAIGGRVGAPPEPEATAPAFRLSPG